MSGEAMPPIRYTSRPAAVQERLAGRTLIVSTPSNIRWLTGFGGSLGWVVIGPEVFALVTDGRYRDRAEAEFAEHGVTAEVVVGRTRAEVRDAVVRIAGDADGVRAEADHLTHAVWRDLATDLALAPDDGTIAGGRRIKDEGELARMERAAAIADDALAALAPRLGDGLTEADVRDELEHDMRRRGADGPSYATIVGAGAQHGARPHHETGRRPIIEGDTVIIDVGALVDGYHSDMTRSFVVGEPTPEQRDWYELVRVAQAAGMAAVAPGITTGDLDAACRDVFIEAGVADHYLHGTGHGVGLDIHEDPFAAAGGTMALLAGDVVTVEPGLYRDGFGGFRIEDLVAVTASGGRPLTHLPKDSPCLPSRPTT